MLHRSLALTALASVCVALGASQADKTAPKDLLAGLKAGSVELKSAGPLAFGPQGVLFVGDPRATAIYAIDTGDRTEGKGQVKVEGINEKVAGLLGTEAKAIQIADIATNPISGNVYLSVARGRGPDAAAVLVRVGTDGKLTALDLKDVKSARATIPNPAKAGGGKGKMKGGTGDVLTDIGYVNGQVIVAGLSTEEFASNLRSIPYPFSKADRGAGIKIYHGAHGQWETRSPVRVFASYKIGSEDHLLAAYTCTPLVKIPLNKLTPGEKVVGTTVAELGNRNRPLSMIVYNKGGKDYVLMANSARGLMKIPLAGIDKVKEITDPVRGGGTAGLSYTSLKDIGGVQRLDAYGKERAVILQEQTGGRMDLKTIELP